MNQTRQDFLFERLFFASTEIGTSSNGLFAAKEVFKEREYHKTG